METRSTWFNGGEKIMCGYRNIGKNAFIFALGLSFSFFCPDRVIIIVIAIALMVLAISLMRC